MQIDVNKMQSYSGSLSKFKDQYFDFGLVDGHFPDGVYLQFFKKD